MAAIVSFKHKGDFTITYEWAKRMHEIFNGGKFHEYGRDGVQALADATPKDTGKTASSWIYSVDVGDGGLTLDWFNTNVNKGINIAIILQYGHGTGTGGYVPGIDYINPAMEPLFEKIANELWKEVIRK